MSVGTELRGARLEFVLRPIKGSVTREIVSFDKKTKTIKRDEVELPAGNILFLPSGLSYRISDREAKQRGFDRTPAVLGFAEANDTKTAAGRFKLAITEKDRLKAWKDMEQTVITVCTRQSGSITNSIHAYNSTPVKGEKVNVRSAA